MKKQDLFKFSLTAMCVAVLSACGSSGGGSLAVDNANTTPSANANANTGAANSAELAAAQKAAQEAAAQKAAAEKAAAEAAAKQAEAEKAAAAAKTAAEKAAAEKAAAEAKAAAEKAAAEKAAKEAAAKAAADQAAAVKKAAEEAAKKALADKEAADKAAAKKAAEEAAAKKAAEEAAKAAAAASDKTNPFGAKDKLTAEPDTTRNQSFVGFKQTVKNNSNLATNTSTKSDSTSDIPTPMAVQAPHASLDTIVVAEPKNDAGSARVYLEDFDTRTNRGGFLGALNTDRGNGKGIFGNRTLQHIYIASNTSEKTGDPVIEKEREALDKAVKDVEAAIKAVKQEAVNIDKDKYPEARLTPKNNVSELETLQKQEEAILAQTYPSLSANAVTALQKAQRDVVNAKRSELYGKLAQLQQKIDSLQADLTKAQLAANTFTAKNPKPDPIQPISRETDASFGYETKTKTMGDKPGAIWTYAYEDVRHKHQNFTEKSSDSDKRKHSVTQGYVYAGKDVNGNIIANSHDVGNLSYTDVNTYVEKNVVQGRNLDDTVAELYGYRSKAMPNFDTPLDKMDLTSEGITGQPTTTRIANNLPLVNEYNGAKLENVQYGRVTTALDGKAATEEYFKKGLQLNTDGTTYVASFGEYGKEGTENHYFFRGINNVGGTELTQLKKDEKNGIITYNGHAVTYGLNNNYRGNIPIPTALGARTGFVSGNHVSAAVNLANGEVTGNIYNKWFDSYNSPKDLVQVDLVSFKGKLADNGNIAGTSTRLDNNTPGLFGATLYGKGAEMGGIVASEATGADKWGGSFGAIRVPATPEEKAKAGMAVGADQKN